MPINDYVALVDYHQRERAMIIRNERRRVALERADTGRGPLGLSRLTRRAHGARRRLAH